jgi:hypothetical protein
MDEVRLWRWRYTNKFGKRVERSWHMSEKDAAHYKDPERIAGTLEVRSFAALPKANDINNNTVRAAKAARADAQIHVLRACLDATVVRRPD